MKKTLFFLVILSLSACATPTTAVNAPIAPIAPNVAAVYANQTKQAFLDQAADAQQQEDALNSQSTATAAALTAEAFAPFAQATQAAVNLQVQKMYGDATSTSAAATQTAYAVQQAYNAQATSTAGAATQVAAFTQQAFLVQKDKDEKDAQSRAFTNMFWAWAKPILFILFVAAVIIAGLTIMRLLRHKAIARDDYGKTQPILDIVKGEYVDLSASPNYAHRDQSILEQMFAQWLEKKYGFVPDVPRITADRQDLVKQREQVIEVERIRRTRLPKALIDAQSLRFLPEPIDEATDMQDGDPLAMFPLPKWDLFTQYQFEQGGEFPFGSYQNGLARIDINKFPHVGLIGPSGSGKSRLFLRAFIASALASGNRVIVLGDMVDFMVFKAHANASLIPIWEITKPTDAAQYVTALQAINSEMEKRLRHLTEHGQSTWQRQGGENTLIVLDELGPNLDILDDTNPATARALRGYLSILINKGRKAGFNFVFTGTRAVGLKKQLSQVSTIAFRLKDTDEERYTFGQSGYGANHTPEKYFLSRIGGDIHMTGSFNPTDEDLLEFIFEHRTKELPKPDWIEGVIVNQPELPVRESARLTKIEPTPAMARAEFVSGLSGWEVRALELYEAGMDQAAIVESVFADDNPEIGKVAVADLIKRWRAVKAIELAPQPQADTKVDEIAELAEKIRSRWTPALNKTQTSELLGKTYEGTSWVKKVNQVIEYLKSTTPTEPQVPSNGGFHPSFQ